MRLHRNLILAAVSGIEKILIGKEQADVVVQDLLKSNSSWGGRDRNFIADNIYHLVRYKRLYESCIEKEIDSVEDIWNLLGAKFLITLQDIPDWPEWKDIDRNKISVNFEHAYSIRKLRESYPDWLDDLFSKELGDQWEQEAAALNTAATLSIRVNSIKSNSNKLQDELAANGVVTWNPPNAPDALVLTERKNLRTDQLYKNGHFEIQDVSSQLVAPLLELKPGMRVLDACAGAGGKTLHISALMKNKGQVIALDPQQVKLNELQKRAKRAGVGIVKTLLSDNFTPAFNDKFDRILLDVPCSGSGVFRRKPDAKWQLTPEIIKELKQTQFSILNLYAPLLKSGGILVYSTCSILPSENEKQIELFLSDNPDFSLLKELKISPAKSGFDGFYVAQLTKS